MNEISHTHRDDIIVDADKDFKFVIDTASRAITSTSTKKLTLMQYDKKSERYSFEIDREIDGHDLMDCNRVQIHFINIGSNKQKHPGLYRVDDVQVMPSDDKKLTFTWLVSQDATMFDGILSFLVSFECVDTDCEDIDDCNIDEHILYRWSSNIFKSINITTGMDNNNTIKEMYADELLAWQIEMETKFIPDLVDERYVERVFATAEEVAAVFDISNPDGTVETVIIPFEEVTEYVDNAILDNLQSFKTNCDEDYMPKTQVDAAPTDNSENLVTSGGVKAYVDDMKTYVDEVVSNSIGNISDLLGNTDDLEVE